MQQVSQIDKGADPPDHQSSGPCVKTLLKTLMCAIRDFLRELQLSVCIRPLYDISIFLFSADFLPNLRISRDGGHLAGCVQQRKRERFLLGVSIVDSVESLLVRYGL